MCIRDRNEIRIERFGAVWTGEKSLADDWGPGLSQLSLLVGPGSNNALGMLEWERLALSPHVLRRFGLFLQIRWRYPSDGAGKMCIRDRDSTV